MCSTLTLVYFDFVLLFIFYVDESKKKKYKVILYQINKNKVKYSILFFSRNLLDAEIKYWAIELKVEIFV